MLKKITGLFPKILRRIYLLADYFSYSRTATPYRELAATFKKDRGAFLLMAGRGMNVLWAQIWSVLSLSVCVHGFRGWVATSRQQWLVNRYFRLLNLKPIYIEDYLPTGNQFLPEEIRRVIDNACSFSDFRDICYRGAPIGKIALSTYSRNIGTGIVDPDEPEVRKELKTILYFICSHMHAAYKVYEKFNVKVLFFTEVFMEEFGAFYYAALEQKLNVIRLAGTVRDNAILSQHLTYENDNIHHSCISPSDWETLRDIPFTEEMQKELNQNFLDRYGDKWWRSKRNHAGTRLVAPKEAREMLNVPAEKKVAVIFSHILYDTLFFFGTDLFQDYAEWLVESVKTACENPNVHWLVKVHPSNIWRGELNSLLQGRYEEETILEQRIGSLPEHVQIVSPDTPINPYSWFQFADYGITVRGTSGLEMAALGKNVITAGTGRYEGNGFTHDPPDAEAYLNTLRNLHEIPALPHEQALLARRYAYALFVLKPFSLTSLTPRLRTGAKDVYASDDMVYMPTEFEGSELPEDLKTFSDWVLKTEQRDLISRPPEGAVSTKISN